MQRVKLILLLIVIFTISYLSAQTNLLTQGFESLPFPPAGWSNVRITGPSFPGNWARFANGVSPVQTPHTGAWQLRYNSANFGAGTSGEMRTSILDFTTTGTYTVSFWMYRDNWVGTDKLEVLVNTAQTATGATLLGTINRDRAKSPSEASNGWYQYTFTIPSIFNSNTNYIIFKATSGFGKDIYVDDISVDRGAAATPGCVTLFSPANGASGLCTNATLSWDIVPLASGYKITAGNNAPDFNNLINDLDVGVALNYTDIFDPSTTYGWKIIPYNGFGEAIGCMANTFTTGSGVCYCTPVYLEGSCGTDDFMDDFSTTGGINNITNNNSGCTTNANNYTFFAAQNVTVVQGGNFNVSMQSGPDFAEGFAIWIDYNIDGDFDDAGEYVFNSAISTTEIINGNIIVPYAATVGNTRMRVRCAYNYVPTSGTACATLNEGETEDYTITINACTPIIYYADTDGDSFGDVGATASFCSTPDPGYVLNNTDCNDAVAAIYPGAAEVCNGIDDNCDVLTDNGLIFITYYQDADNDLFGNNLSSISICNDAPAGYLLNNADCNDANATIFPGAIEQCNLIDDDCDFIVDENVLNAVITPSGPTTFCSPGNITLQANSGIGYTYQWLRNGSNVGGATAANYITNKSGNYQVKITVPGGCNNTSLITTVTVNKAPKATITAPGGTDLCGHASLLLKSANGAGYTFQWIKNGANIAGATANTYSATTIGNYKVKVTNAAGCSKISAATAITKSCKMKAENLLSNSIQVFPNPANDVVQINVFVPGIIENEQVTIHIYDISGRIIYADEISVVSDQLNTTINSATWPAGVYLVKAIHGDIQQSTQLIISR